MTRNEKKALREKRREEKRRKRAELDTQTTVADMNVEGFSWYNPKRKTDAKNQGVKLTRKEYWAMVRGAFLAMLPMQSVQKTEVPTQSILWISRTR